RGSRAVTAAGAAASSGSREATRIVPEKHGAAVDVHGGSFLNRSSLLLAELRVVAFRFLEADQAIALGVDLPAPLVAAVALRARHVAIAVKVHLAEPQGTGRRLRRSRPGRAPEIPAEGGRGNAKVARIHRAAIQRQLVGARDVVLAEIALVAAVQLRQQLRRLTHLAQTEPAVAVAVQQV